MQSGVLTRSKKNCPADVNAVINQAEICNQVTEEGSKVLLLILSCIVTSMTDEQWDKLVEH